MSYSLPLEQHKLLGLFELDPAGTVLYARMEPGVNEQQQQGGLPDVTGANFFDEVAPHASAAELRRRIAAFTAGAGQADNFNFTCQLDGGTLPLRVLLARISERTNGQRTKSILVHVRKI